MEENYQKSTESAPYNPKRNSRLGRFLGGLVIVLAGSAILLKRAGMEFPYWLFSFEMLIVTVGLYVWARHEFKRPAGLFLMLVGGFLLLDDFIPDLRIGPFIWPIIIIAAGVWMMVSPGRSARHRHFKKRMQSQGSGSLPGQDESEEDYLNSSAVFGGIKKRYFSKNFKGGRVVCMMGGSEIDLGGADITEPVTIDVSLVFGGVKLIIPSNWEVRSELVAIAGGVEDKRHQPAADELDDKRILILRGTAIFGGIDIKSY